MNNMYLEHANITVSNVDEAVRFFTAAFPDFKIRGKGDGWIHLGTEESYIAIDSSHSDPKNKAHPYSGVGINHLGFVVSDVDALRQRLLDAGFNEGYVPEPHPHRKRVYFHDGDGMEYEFVQYFSEKNEEKNDYKL